MSGVPDRDCDSPDFDRAATILAGTTGLSVADRAQFLERMCGNDAELRREVEMLLREQSGGTVQTAMLRGAAGLAVFSLPEEVLPIELERYRLEARIGEGSFGVVYRAMQKAPIRRQVAVKVLHPGLNSVQVLKRFDIERQALAMLQHQHIARLHDAGNMPDGRPFFAMEFIDGVSITQYCDQHKLDIRKRLALFMQVCHAVQHVHQKGIIHRDIKPTNILVVEEEGLPVPKVLDFGIAKATQGELTELTMHTQMQQFMGTPDYMSPEQAQLSTLDVDTRSDIYSLGVVLYELLTGKRPFDAKVLLNKGIDELRRAIREEEPPRPSACLRKLPLDELKDAAEKRDSEAARLPRALQGDLDSIITKCLEKDRARRYQTANDLARDIERHLDNEPVEARPANTIYRMGKFIRRHRATAAALVAVLAAAGFGVGLYIHGIHAEQRRTLAEQERTKDALAKALEQQQIADAVNAFLNKMLQRADPDNNQGSQEATVLQAVRAAVKELDAGTMRDRPMVEAALREIIGKTLRDLNHFDEAEPNLRLSLEIRRRVLPANDPNIATTAVYLGTLERSLGHGDAAESLYREALAIRRASLRPDDPEIGVSMLTVGGELRAKGQTAQAEAMFRDALTILHKPGADPALLIMGMGDYSSLLLSLDRNSEAETLSREAVTILEKSLPPDFPDQGARASLAWAFMSQHRYEEAEPLFLKALEVRRAVRLDPDPSIAQYLSGLGRSLASRGRHADADPLFRESVGILRRLPSQKSVLAGALCGWSWSLRSLGRFQDAEKVCREAIDVSLVVWPEGHREVADALVALAWTLRDQGKPADAEPIFQRALQMRWRWQPAYDPSIGLDLLTLGNLALDLKRPEEAEAKFRVAATILHAAGPEYSQNLVWALSGVGWRLQARHELGDAAAFLNEALEIQKRMPGARSQDTIMMAQGLANVLDQAGRSQDAKALRQEFAIQSSPPRSAATK